MTPTSFESMQIEQGGFFQAGTTENLYGYIKQDMTQEKLQDMCPKGHLQDCSLPHCLKE